MAKQTVQDERQNPAGPSNQPETEEARLAYQAFLQELMVTRLWIGGLMALVLPLVPLVAVGIVDPASRDFDFTVKVLLALYILVPAMILWSRSKWFLRNSFAIIMVTSMLLVSLLVLFLMTMEMTWSGAIMSFLLSMAIISIGVVYPFHAYQAALFSVYCLALYLVPIPFLEASTVWSAHAYNIITIICFALIATIDSYFTGRLRRANFFGQLALKELNEKLHQEREKSDRLLQNMLPISVSERLKVETKTIADKYAEATVLFADLVGFTALSSSMLPSRLIGLIDDLFSRFDAIVEKYGLEKIKTIGDSYMAVGGVPVENDHHAISAAEAALEMRDEIYKFNREAGESLDVRIGIHSGPLVAGVIGRKKMSYDVWGDTVNTASRMESTSEKGKIQISETTYHFIKGKFQTEERGKIDIKGKGMMKTYYLLDGPG